MECEDEMVEGIVTYCDDRLARVWIEAVKQEKEINFAYHSRQFGLGDWISISVATDEVCKINPCLETRVLEIGVAQVKTEVIFSIYDEKIGHGTVIQSKHFGRVAVFTPFSGIILGRIYSVFVERIPRDRFWNEQESGAYWFVPSNQTPRIVPSNNYPKNDVRLLGPLIGVVVSRTMRHAFIWTPTLGEGVCGNEKVLLIGRWIEFTANLYGESHNNINFEVVQWIIADPVLSSTPLTNNLMLTSTIFVSQWPMNSLVADWIGLVRDRKHVLEEAVHRFGVGRTYEVMLKRMKKSEEEPITIWDVCQFVKCVDGGKRAGIVCYVDIQKSLAFIYVPDTDRVNGRKLRVDLKIFDTVPALGDWFMFEVDGSGQYWLAKSAVKSRKLCNTRVLCDRLEVETEVVLTDQVSTRGHRIAFSTILGAVEDDTNKLRNATLDISGRYLVWCVTMRAVAPDDPCWRVSCISTISPTTNGGMVTATSLDKNREEGDDDVSYDGIVVSECNTSCFVWTPSLGEGINHFKGNLQIGDWIRFWVSRRPGKPLSGNLHFFVDRWQKIERLFPARREDKTAVVTMELPIPVEYRNRKPPSIPFFGEILDRRQLFGKHIDAIRGHSIEIDIRRIKTEKCVTGWDITYVQLKEPLKKQKSSGPEAVEVNAGQMKVDAVADISLSTPITSTLIQRTNSFFTTERAWCGRNSSSSGRRDYENHQPSMTHNEENEKRGEDCSNASYPLEDNVELDPVICSMRLFFMSKEVREAIKANCKEGYRTLCEFYDVVP